MAEAIYVRYEGRYWRLSVLFARYGVTYTSGYKRHLAYGRPKIYKRWMLVPTGEGVAKPIAIEIEGVPYKSIKEACLTLGIPTNRISRRMKKYGVKMSMEQLMEDDPRRGLKNLGKAAKRPSSEWEMLSNKGNTGAARRL